MKFSESADVLLEALTYADDIVHLSATPPLAPPPPLKPSSGGAGGQGFSCELKFLVASYCAIQHHLTRTMQLASCMAVDAATRAQLSHVQGFRPRAAPWLLVSMSGAGGRHLGGQVRLPDFEARKAARVNVNTIGVSVCFFLAALA